MPEGASNDHLRSWQDRLLPSMSLMIIAGALYFAITSSQELQVFYSKVDPQEIDSSVLLPSPDT